MPNGVIFNIQRHSLHDGPGIRTTVFLKGCPLSCLWCHNPESQDPRPAVIRIGQRCAGCGTCAAVCPNGAIAPSGETRDWSKCSACGLCAQACPWGAREVVGRVVSVEEVMSEVLKDRVFYEESGGGVTFSGGEPLIQGAFLRGLLEACKREGVSTALDTSGFAPWGEIEPLVPLVDVFLYDLKLMDDKRHRIYVGASNASVLDNLARLSREVAGTKTSIVARLPLVPGINDGEENIRETGKFLRSCGVSRADVLPYHDIGMDKYGRLGRAYRLAHLRPPDEESLRRTVSLLRSLGLDVKVGG